MARYKLTISYDGTQYCGWQVQPSPNSIQGIIQGALETVLRHPVSLTGSGRTDAGVHAKGQTAHFDTDLPVDLGKLRLSLNALLPPDIRALEVTEVLETFHARYSALSKIYHYYLHLDSIVSPFERLYRYQVYKKLDLEKLKLAARQFLGTHDFTSFTNEPQRGSVVHDPVRTLTRLDIVQIEGGIRLEFEADGFLYKMVRNITGTLIDCASGRFEPTAIRDLFAAKDRRKAGYSAPAHGLFLMQVRYDALSAIEAT